MFLNLSLSHSVHRGVPGQVPLGRYTLLGRYIPRAGTPQWQVHTPPGRYTAPQQCMLGYGQHAGGTHPTGMHSFLQENLFFLHSVK